jgi:hypothetical protein
MVDNGSGAFVRLTPRFPSNGPGSRAGQERSDMRQDAVPFFGAHEDAKQKCANSRPVNRFANSPGPQGRFEPVLHFPDRNVGAGTLLDALVSTRTTARAGLNFCMVRDGKTADSPRAAEGI